METLPDFREIEDRVFHVAKDGTIFVGREGLTEDIRSVLRDEAEYIKNSRLWEIVSASIEQEAIELALLQSSNFDHVLSAKQLHHFRHFVNNVIHILAKK